MQEKDLLELLKDERFCNYCLHKNEEDVQYWEDWLSAHPEDRAQIEGQKMLLQLLAGESARQVADQQYAKLLHQMHGGRPRSLLARPVLRWVAAACLLAAVGLSIYLFRQPGDKLAATAGIAQQVVPGRSQALLTLSNGDVISLGKQPPGALASQPGSTVAATDSGQISYTADQNYNTSAAPAVYNTLSTPVGGQFQVVLPDGSHVWLNAQTKLKYPTHFAATDRQVELISGEAYFEVVADKARPFAVRNQSQVLEVLGTRFNIAAYEDEALTRTTLVEGAVRVNASAIHKAVVLHPGQQVSVSDKGMMVTDQVDVEDVTAWKDGYFKFHEPLSGIMQKLSRWYNVDVVYDPRTNKNQLFTGHISRSRALEDVLQLMELTGDIHFEVRGRTVLVKP